MTYQEDLADWAQVEREVARLAREVAAETQGRPSQRVVVKVRYQPFFTSTHGAAVKPPGDDAETLAAAALEALGRFTDRRPVRLLGVRAEFAAPES